MPGPLRLRFSSWWIVLPLVVTLWIMLDHAPPKPPHQAEWLDAGGTLVRAVRAGEGDTTLLLIHGFGESLTTWRAVFDRLASRARVIAFYLPGSTRPQKPTASSSWDTRWEASWRPRWRWPAPTGSSS